MEAPAETVALMRALVSVAAARCTGTLEIRSPGHRCTLALVDGGLRGAVGGRDSRLLGDWLLSRGELDVAAHAALLRASEPAVPVGAWLAQHGIASPGAIAQALLDQCRARVVATFAWPGLQFRLERGSPDLGVPWLDTSLELRELVLQEAARMCGPAEREAWFARNARARLTCSAFGERLLRDVAVRSQLGSLRERLRHGARVAELAAECSELERATLMGLLSLSAVKLTQPVTPVYSLLLRKRGQLRRRATATELLEIRCDAKADEARRALRRLAGRVHPDALGPSAPHALRELSSEVMRALLDAEGSLRVSAAAR